MVRVNYRAAPRAIWARMTFGTRNSSLSFSLSLTHSPLSSTAGARVLYDSGLRTAQRVRVYVTVVYYNCVICIQTHSRNLSRWRMLCRECSLLLTIFLFLIPLERASHKTSFVHTKDLFPYNFSGNYTIGYAVPIFLSVLQVIVCKNQTSYILWPFGR
jgi:hypothetical protein